MGSILYKTKLPFVLVFNKTDIVSHEFASEWMQDYESFRAAIEQETSYMGTLIQSMGLVLDEFYQHLKVFVCFLGSIAGASFTPPPPLPAACWCLFDNWSGNGQVL